MFDSENLEVRFRCTGCGVCCTTPPAINIFEIVEQSKNFVLGAQLRIISEASPSSIQDVSMMATTYPELHVLGDHGVRDRLAAHMSKMAQDQGVPISSPITASSSPKIAFSLTDVDQLSRSCTQRAEDGSCNIYETRPSKCRVVPLDETVPEQDAGLSAAMAIEKMIAHGGTCETGPEADLLWQDGRIVDPEARTNYLESGIEMHEAVAAMSREIVEEYLDYKAMESGLDRTTVENVVEQMASDRTRPTFAIVPALARCLKRGVLPASKCVEILRNQARLIEKRLPHIDPEEEIFGIYDAKMKVVLADWRSMYLHIADAWDDQEPRVERL
jgi:Fe-S-cluster containining protein